MKTRWRPPFVDHCSVSSSARWRFYLHLRSSPDSFSSLPEYADEERFRSKSASECRSSAATSPTSVARSECSVREDPNVVILKTFEDTTRRSPSNGKISKFSPTSEISDPFCNLSLSPIFPALPSPGVKVEEIPFLDPRLDQQSQDSTLFSHFRHVVWRQLFPHDHNLDDGSDNHFMTLNVDFLEQEATRFPPVSIKLFFYCIDTNFLALRRYDGCLGPQSLT